MIKTIYHGSQQIVKIPSINKGKLNNDYGRGFYCTQDLELAKEWAVSFKKDGYANVYQINTKGLKILDLDKYCALTWLAILIENRKFTVRGQIGNDSIDYLNKYFLIDYKKYDIITGYRADDSYFDFASSFINNALSLETLEKALKYGNLGKQIVLISDKAFSKIKYKNSLIADHNKYYLARKFRDDYAREQYRNNKFSHNGKGTYIKDIIEKGLTKDDFK